MSVINIIEVDGAEYALPSGFPQGGDTDSFLVKSSPVDGDTRWQNCPLPLNMGGTGANTASAARNNLGISLPLAISSGGTGSVTASAARTALGAAKNAIDTINDGFDIVADIGDNWDVETGETTLTVFAGRIACLHLPIKPIVSINVGKGSGGIFSLKTDFRPKTNAPFSSLYVTGSMNTGSTLTNGTMLRTTTGSETSYYTLTSTYILNKEYNG